MKLTVKHGQYGQLITCAAVLKVLLVSGSKDPAKWVVPGGGIEPTEDTCKAALRECEEEAGVIGVLGRYVGQFQVIISKVL